MFHPINVHLCENVFNFYMRQHLNKLEIHKQIHKQIHIQIYRHLAVCILATVCRVQDGQDSDQDNHDSHQGGQNNHQDNQDSHQVNQEMDLWKQEMELFL